MDLAVILDACNRQIVGRSMSDTLSLPGILKSIFPGKDKLAIIKTTTEFYVKM